MFTAPVMPSARLQTRSVAGPSTRRKHGSTTEVASAEAMRSPRRPMRSESAPKSGAAMPRSRCSHRNATPTVARSIPASRTNQMPRKVTRLIRAATAMKFAARTVLILLSRSPNNPDPRAAARPASATRAWRTALGVEQRLALLAEEHLLDLAEEDGVRAVHELLHHAAVERHERVDQHRRAGRKA